MRHVYARQFKLDFPETEDLFSSVQADFVKCLMENRKTRKITNEKNDARTVTLEADYIGPSQSVVGGYFVLNTDTKTILAIDDHQKVCVESLKNPKSEIMFFIYGNGFGFYSYYNSFGLDSSFEKFGNAYMKGRVVRESVMRSVEQTKDFIEKSEVTGIQFTPEYIPNGVKPEDVKSNTQTIIFRAKTSNRSFVSKIIGAANFKARIKGGHKFIDISNAEVESLINSPIGNTEEMTASILSSIINKEFDFKKNLYFNKIYSLYHAESIKRTGPTN